MVLVHVLDAAVHGCASPLKQSMARRAKHACPTECLCEQSVNAEVLISLTAPCHRPLTHVVGAMASDRLRDPLYGLTERLFRAEVRHTAQ
jgi:hypothetical protein